MKVLLIQPPYPFSEFPKPSSALLSLGTLLKRDGFEVEILDLLSTRCTPEKIEKRLARFQPEVIGATSVTMNFPMALQTLQHCKKLAPETLTIMGGPHVTFTAEETCATFRKWTSWSGERGRKRFGNSFRPCKAEGAWKRSGVDLPAKRKDPEDRGPSPDRRPGPSSLPDRTLYPLSVTSPCASP